MLFVFLGFFYNQTCLFMCMSDLDHNFHSYKYKVYSIKSCNKMCSFTYLSSLSFCLSAPVKWHLVSAWPFKAPHVFCSFCVVLGSIGISHTWVFLRALFLIFSIVWILCIVAICLNSFLFKIMLTLSPFVPELFPVAFASHLFESYLSICYICLNIEWYAIELWCNNVCIVSNWNKLQPQDAVTQNALLFK